MDLQGGSARCKAHGMPVSSFSSLSAASAAVSSELMSPAGSCTPKQTSDRLQTLRAILTRLLTIQCIARP